MLHSILQFALCAVCALALASPVRADPKLPNVIAKVCKPIEAAVFFGSRFHIKCDTPAQLDPNGDVKIYYFSIGTEDADRVDHALQIVNSAIVSGKKVRIWLRTSATKNPTGCQSTDCRSFTGITLLN